MIAEILHHGVLVRECRLPGERRSDGVFPAHPNGIRLSRTRFLLLYATRGFRGIDEDRSIVYQVRVGGFDGPVVREGLLARSVDDWRPLENGQAYHKDHGHPTAFGVPKGAVIGGRAASNANLFVIKWRVNARAFGAPGQLLKATQTPELMRRTLHVEWMQARLNEGEDDLEVLQPPRPMRQRGYEEGPEVCSAAPCRDMNQAFTCPLPYNAECTEWVDTHHFGWSDPGQAGGNRVAAVKCRYDPREHRYEWTETGAWLFAPEYPAIEASVVPLGDSWGICARPQTPGQPVLWIRTEDPFGSSAPVVVPEAFACCGPVSAFRCADGAVRIFTGDKNASPYGLGRNPLYCWDVDVGGGFAPSRRRVVFDALAAGLPIRPEAVPVADMAKLLPHAGGQAQWIAHRVRTGAINYPANVPVAANPEEKAACGLYAAQVRYAEEHPDPWVFY